MTGDREEKRKESKKNNESSILSHKLYKKKLTPPLLQIPNLKNSSWIHERLPEMLWAVLVIGNMKRDKALDFFRYVGKYVSQNNEFFDVTLSSIGKLPDDKIKLFIQHMLNYSGEIKNILRPLCLYHEIPALEIWTEYSKEPVPKEDFEKISNGIVKTFDHQSQAATDCRWVKLLCYILGGKMKLPNEEKVKEILEYPNYGEMTKVIPTIRASEIILKSDDLRWAEYFWKHSYDSTSCVPEEIFNKKIKSRQEKLSKEIENQRKHYADETKRVRNGLISHFFESCKDTNVDTRRETSFGLALYGLTIFTELIFYSISSAISGRLTLRSLTEIYINFEYLLKKEQEEPKIWDDFHGYGTGQSKLIYLKLKEIKKPITCVELDELSIIANEDKWIEFIPIDLGQWANLDLRKMSEFASVKDIYDMYYNYTSGFVHGTRGSLRESVYQRCLNPLHRFHRIPIFDLPLMPSVSTI